MQFAFELQITTRIQMLTQIIIKIQIVFIIAI